MLEVLTYPDPRLHLKAEHITKFDAELKRTADLMLATMYTENGCGLAAIQVNIQKSIIVIDLSEKGNEPQIFVNPVIVKQSGSQTSDEGCLSFPDLRIKVTRPLHLTVKAENIHGKEFEVNASNFFAKCLDHEIEHLNGQVFIKHLSRLKLHLTLKKLAKNSNAATEYRE